MRFQCTVLHLLQVISKADSCHCQHWRCMCTKCSQLIDSSGEVCSTQTETEICSTSYSIWYRRSTTWPFSHVLVTVCSQFIWIAIELRTKCATLSRNISWAGSLHKFPIKVLREGKREIKERVGACINISWEFHYKLMLCINEFNGICGRRASYSKLKL